MKRYSFICEFDGERIDKTLAAAFPEFSRSYIQKLISDGMVTLDGAPAKKSALASSGAELEVTVPDLQAPEALPEDIPLDIAYEDEHLLVVNKPKGMVVHPAAGNYTGTLVNALLAYCGDSLSGINGVLRPGIVHRIDMDTSGLLIVAKNDFAHQQLAAQLKDHSLARTYEAVVCGNLREESGTVDAPIGRHPTDRKKMAVTEKNSREAVTHWEVVARYNGYTHLRLRLETGRTHQIRVHLAYLNHPILGDLVYGHKKPELGQDTQCLHARELTFRHPRTGEQLTVSCELPDYFRDVLNRLEKI